MRELFAILIGEAWDRLKLFGNAFVLIAMALWYIIRNKDAKR